MCIAKSYYLSELTTDNFGWFAEGAGFLSAFYDASTDVTLVGDEAWEWRGYVANEMETGAAVFPARPSFIIQKILYYPEDLG
jgi:hypothetical protein